MTENDRWSFTGGVIVGTDICEKGIPHTNRSVVTRLNRYERKIRELEDENEQLKQQVEDLYESDKSLRKFASNMTLNYTGICVPRRLFDEVITILKDIEHNDLVEDLSKESIDTIANGR